SELFQRHRILLERGVVTRQPLQQAGGRFVFLLGRLGILSSRVVDPCHLSLGICDEAIIGTGPRLRFIRRNILGSDRRAWLTVGDLEGDRHVFGGGRRASEHKQAASDGGNARWKIQEKIQEKIPEQIHGLEPPRSSKRRARTVAVTYVEMRTARG